MVNVLLVEIGLTVLLIGIIANVDKLLIGMEVNNSVKGNYIAVYKCQMCGKEFRTSDKTIEMEHNDIPALLASVLKNQRFIGTSMYQAPLYLPHRCDNGDGGVAQLIGFRKVGGA